MFFVMCASKKTFPTFENANRFSNNWASSKYRLLKASGPSWCWQKDQSPAVAQGVILTLAKKKNGNWESFAKRYVPRNPGSVIFVDANLFGVVEMVGKFERELYGTTVGSISRSVSLAPRPGHATSPKPYNRWKIIGYGWTVPVYHRVLWAKLNLNTIACPK